jgi:hypothetical protein
MRDYIRRNMRLLSMMQKARDELLCPAARQALGSAR